MDFGTLYGSIPVNANYTIGATSLDNPSLTPFFQTTILRSDLVVYVTAKQAVTAPDGSQAIRLTCSIPADDQDAFLHLDSKPAVVILFQLQAVWQVALDVSLDQGVHWDFSVSYPYLSLCPVALLPARGQHFLLASAAYGTDFSTGFWYTGLVSLAGPYTPMLVLQSFLGAGSPDSLPMRGQIVPAGTTTPGSMGIRMLAKTGSDAGQGGGSLDLGLMKVADLALVFVIASTPSTATPGTLTCEATYGAQGHVDLGTGGYVGLKAWIMLNPATNLPMLRMGILPRGEVVSITQLGSLVVGPSLQSLLQQYCQPLADAFDNAGFISWSGGVSLAGPVTFSDSELRLGTASGFSYTIVPDYLVLKSLVVSWQVLAPTGMQLATLNLVGRLQLPSNLDFVVEFSSTPDGTILLQGTLAGAVPLAVGDWVNALLSSFGCAPLSADMCDFLNQALTLTTIEVALQSATSSTAFSVNVVGTALVTANPIAFTVLVGFEYAAPAWTARVQATAVMGTSHFLVAVESSQSESDPAKQSWKGTFTWSDDEDPLDFEAIAESLGFGIPSIPAELDLGLVRVSAVYDDANGEFFLSAGSNTWGQAVLAAYLKGTTWEYAFNLQLSRQGQVNVPLINLSNLPLVSQAMSPTETIGVDLKVIASTAVLDAARVSTLNAALPQGPLFPGEGFGIGWGFGITFSFGGTVFPLTMCFTGSNTQEQASTPAGSALGQQANAAQASPTGVPAPVAAPVNPAVSVGADGTLWLNVQKAFGPVTFERVGVRYVASKLWFVLDAQLRMGAFDMDVIGLRAGSPLDTFSPSFGIDGLGIDYRTAGFEIGGALLNLQDATGLKFAGTAIVKAMGITAAFAGYYGDLATPSGNLTSMFLFGQVSGLAVGQPAFLITGFSGGIGYNSSLRLPGATEVSQFPFVAGLGNPNAVGGANATPMTVLQTLTQSTGGKQPWVRPAAGQFWGAAGISFTTFGFLDVNALAVLEFGRDFAAALLGIATAQFPKTGTKILAKVQLQLAATYRQSEGALLIQVVLAEGSYVLDPSVRLSGGMALATWFSGTHKGDFVLSLGGYNKQFVRPTWYPSPSRLAINWNYGQTVAMTGESYMAVMPGAFMLGSSVSINYVSGAMRAWFNASFDVFMRFTPLYFKATIGVTVGASYTMDNWFCSKTHKVELGASLALWGPPLGGKVRVEWTVISFDVEFGDKAGVGTGSSRPATWGEFVTLLPPAGKFAAINAKSGMVGRRVDQAKVWIVSGDGFAFSTVSTIPLTAVLKAQGGTALPPVSPLPVNVAPMDKTNVNSRQTVGLSYSTTGTGNWAQRSLDAWTWEVVSQNMPSALWYQNATGLPRGKQTRDNMLVGLNWTAPAATVPNPLTPFDPTVLSAAAASSTMPMPLLAGALPPGAPPAEVPQSLQTVARSLQQPATTQRRQALANAANAMGFAIVLDEQAQPVVMLADYHFEANPMIL